MLRNGTLKACIHLLGDLMSLGHFKREKPFGQKV